METKDIVLSQEQFKKTYSKDEIETIRNQLMPGCTNEQLILFVKVCERVQLDPFARQIYAFLQTRWDKKLGSDVSSYVHLVSIDGLRIIAERSGKYRGQLPVVWCGEDGRWVDVWLSKEPPLAAKVGVLRSDFSQPLFAVATMASYGKTGQDFKTKQMGLIGNWKSMPEVMLAKCAESLALRKAFPNDLSGIYTEEEMDRVISDTDRLKKGQQSLESKSKVEIETPLPVQADAASETLSHSHRNMGELDEALAKPGSGIITLEGKDGDYIIPGGIYKGMLIRDLGPKVLEVMIDTVCSLGPQKRLGFKFLENAIGFRDQTQYENEKKKETIEDNIKY
jgi:phage recombination protein Bet